MSDKQKTLKTSFSIKGVGLHTGSPVEITVHPADENHGFAFRRIDMDGSPVIPARLENVFSTQRGTSLKVGVAEVHTTEHLLAALFGLKIDNALIDLTGPEIPIMDGSSKYFVEAIEKVGIVDQDADKDYLILGDNIKFENTEKNVEMLAVPDQEFRITVMVDYHSPLLGTQHASMFNLGEYKEQISRCRTFVFLRELLNLVNAGLIKGGDVDNAIVMCDTDLAESEKDILSSTFNRDKSELETVGIGILNNVKLQFENEPARHKLLDIIGDLALIGRPIKGHILAARPGHQTNVEFGKILRDSIVKAQKEKAYDPTRPAIIDTKQITNLLPHRYPFLLIDKVIELGDNHVVGVKNVTRNEEFFNGHFPDEPVMPGVLIVEALAQTGGILVLSSVEQPELYSTYFAKIDKVKFKRMVVPGDSLILKMELIAPIRRGMCVMKATAFVGNQIACEGELMAQIVKNRG